MTTPEALPALCPHSLSCWPWESCHLPPADLPHSSKTPQTDNSKDLLRQKLTSSGQTCSVMAEFGLTYNSWVESTIRNDRQKLQIVRISLVRSYLQTHHSESAVTRCEAQVYLLVISLGTHQVPWNFTLTKAGPVHVLVRSHPFRLALIF